MESADWLFGLVLGCFEGSGFVLEDSRMAFFGPFLHGIVAFGRAILGGADSDLAFWRARDAEPLLCDRMEEAA